MLFSNGIYKEMVINCDTISMDKHPKFSGVSCKSDVLIEKNTWQLGMLHVYCFFFIETLLMNFSSIVVVNPRFKTLYAVIFQNLYCLMGGQCPFETCLVHRCSSLSFESQI